MTPARLVGQSVRMRIVRVGAAQKDQLAVLADLLNAAGAVDDPQAWPHHPEILAADLEFGYDLEPAETYLAYDQDQVPVAMMMVEAPKRDNRHLIFIELVVHPAHRRRGHGTALMREVLRRADDMGRNTIWGWAPSSDYGAAGFAERFGFKARSQDARRRQVLAEVDWPELDRLEAGSRAASPDYDLVRMPQPPLPDSVLTELAAVAAAINDAPMGDLTWEDEVYDLPRMRDAQTARVGRRERVYRVVARHIPSGEMAGHTYLVCHPALPRHAWQADTAVARSHRGHQLGLRLKIDALRWLIDEQPQVEAVDTWNNATNQPMIAVNELMGYRLSQLQSTYELKLS